MNKNAYKTGTYTIEQEIMAICIFLAGCTLYYWYSSFDGLHYILFDSPEKIDLNNILFLFPLILTPSAAILFWARKRIGWFLAVVYSAYTIVSELILILLLAYIQLNGFAASYQPVTPHVVLILLNGLCLWRLSKATICKRYTIKRSTMLRTIVLAIIGAIFISVGIMT
jgi:hypothetical protein